MRADMAKVIVERPRLGSRTRGTPKGYRRSTQRLAEGGPPTREGMKRRCRGGTKHLNEHLGPLRRYLDKQVGRPWDKVFAEICAHINRSNPVQDHVRDHVEDYDVTHVILIDGVPCSGKGRCSSYGTPLHAHGRYTWYVCPRTGLLRRVQGVESKRQRQQRRRHKEAQPKYVPVGESLQCRYLEGAWHLITLQPLPKVGHQRKHATDVDVLLNRPVNNLVEEDARKYYGAAVYAAARRRLTRKELSQYPIPVHWWNGPS